MRTFRTLGLAVAAFAVAATFAPAANAHPDPPCKLYWERQPSVTDNGNGTYTVDPGRAYWVC